MKINGAPGEKLPGENNDASNEGTNQRLFHCKEVLVPIKIAKNADVPQMIQVLYPIA